MVTLPAASMTASSEPVGPQHKCFNGPPSMVWVNGGVGVGWLRAQEPSREEHRRFRSSSVLPPGVIEAMQPHFDQAIALRQVNRGAKPAGGQLTGSSHSPGARQCAGRALL